MEDFFICIRLVRPKKKIRWGAAAAAARPSNSDEHRTGETGKNWKPRYVGRIKGESTLTKKIRAQIKERPLKNVDFIDAVIYRF